MKTEEIASGMALKVTASALKKDDGVALKVTASALERDDGVALKVTTSALMGWPLK